MKLLCAFSSGSPYPRFHGRPPFGFRSCPGCRPQARVLRLVNLVRLAQQRRDLALQPLFLFLHPVVAHRLALARVRSHLRPVDRQLPQPRQPQLLRQTDHLHEQRLEILQMPTPELAQRPMLRKTARRQHPEPHVLFQLPRDPPRREHPRRVPVEQHLHHHPRVIRRVATPVPLVRRVERRQVQTVHQIAHVVRQVTLGQPLPHIRRQQQRLLRQVGAECRRHRAPSLGDSPTIVAAVSPRSESGFRTWVGVRRSQHGMLLACLLAKSPLIASFGRHSSPFQRSAPTRPGGASVLLGRCRRWSHLSTA